MYAQCSMLLLILQVYVCTMQYSIVKNTKYILFMQTYLYICITISKLKP